MEPTGAKKANQPIGAVNCSGENSVEVKAELAEFVEQSQSVSEARSDTYITSTLSRSYADGQRTGPMEPIEAVECLGENSVVVRAELAETEALSQSVGEARGNIYITPTLSRSYADKQQTDSMGDDVLCVDDNDGKDRGPPKLNSGNPEDHGSAETDQIDVNRAVQMSERSKANHTYVASCGGDLSPSTPILVTLGVDEVGSGVFNERQEGQGQKSPVCRLTVISNGVALNVCVDSGATLNLLSKEAYDRVVQAGGTMKLCPVRQKLKGASGKELRVDGWTHLPFEIEKLPYETNVLVGELYGVDLLLGMDWLTSVQAKINFDAMIAELRPNHIIRLRTTENMETNARDVYVVPEKNDINDIKLYPGAPQGYVTVAETQTITSGRAALVTCHCTGNWKPGDELYFEATLDLGDKTRLISSIVELKKGNLIEIPVLNADRDGLTVSKGLLIGQVEAVQAEEEIQKEKRDPSKLHTCPIYQVKASPPWIMVHDESAGLQDDLELDTPIDPSQVGRKSVAGMIPDKGAEPLPGVGRQPCTEQKVPPVESLAGCIDDFKVRSERREDIDNNFINRSGGQEVETSAEADILESKREHLQTDESSYEESSMTKSMSAMSDSDCGKTPVESRLPAHLRGMISPDHSLRPKQRREVEKVILEYQDVFVGPDKKVGYNNDEVHRIDTGDNPPYKSRPRAKSLAEKEEISKEIASLLAAGKIRPSKSPWGAPVVLARKKDGTLRFCIDFRQLNAVTKKDAYPIPRIDECLDCLNGSKYFCTMDLASGYWQVAMAKEDIEKTAFTTHEGLFEWLVMPFGLCNAPATFGRTMEKALHGLVWRTCLVYLDDIVTFGKTFQKALSNLKEVLSRLRKANLKLKPKKCEFFKSQVEYLGHDVSAEGIRPSKSKVRALHDWVMPKTLTEIRSFLGFCSYYRKFVPEFSMKAAPLIALTQKNATVDTDSDACRKAFIDLKAELLAIPLLFYVDPDLPFVLDADACDTGIGGALSQRVKDEYGEEMERPIAFGSKRLNRTRRNYCTTKKELYAIVYFMRYWRNYTAGSTVHIRTDHGSLRWLLNFGKARSAAGAAMYVRWCTELTEYDIQIEHRPGAKHINADFLSRIQRKCPYPKCPQCGDEMKYNEKLRDSESEDSESEGDDDVDSSTLDETKVDEKDGIYIQTRSKTKKETSETGTARKENRRSLRLMEKKLTDAEKPVDKETPEPKRRSKERNKQRRLLRRLGVDSGIDTGEESSVDVRAEKGEDSGKEASKDVELPKELPGTNAKQSPMKEDPMGTKQEMKGSPVVEMSLEKTPDDWIKAQSDDPVLRRVMELKKSCGDEMPSKSVLQAEIEMVRKLCQYWHDLEYDVDGIFSRKIENRTAKDTSWSVLVQRIVPTKWQQSLFARVHRVECMHLGYDKVYSVMFRRFFWWGMSTDVKDWTKACDSCQRTKLGVGGSKMPPVIDTVGTPLLRVGVDLQGPFPTTPRGNKYILVVEDYCSRWLELFALPDKAAMTVAKKMHEEIFTRYGACERLHSDQGSEFVNRVMKDLCDYWGIVRTTTSPYYPQSNGLVERMNKNIKNILKQSCERQDWDEILPNIRLALNNVEHRATGVTPFKMFFSRCEEARLPLDLLVHGKSAERRDVCLIDYAVQQKALCEELAEIVRKNTGKAVRMQVDNAENAGLRIRNYRVGDLVWRYNPPGANTKLRADRWTGPYRIEAVNETNNVIKIFVEAIGRGQEKVLKWINMANVKPCRVSKRFGHTM